MSIEKARLHYEQYLDAGDADRSGVAQVAALERFVRVVAQSEGGPEASATTSEAEREPVCARRDSGGKTSEAERKEPSTTLGKDHPTAAGASSEEPALSPEPSDAEVDALAMELFELWWRSGVPSGIPNWRDLDLKEEWYAVARYVLGLRATIARLEKERDTLKADLLVEERGRAGWEYSATKLKGELAAALEKVKALEDERDGWEKALNDLNSGCVRLEKELAAIRATLTDEQEGADDTEIEALASELIALVKPEAFLETRIARMVARFFLEKELSTVRVERDRYARGDIEAGGER